jgi:hypothetical protein
MFATNLGEIRRFAGFILGDFVQGVLATFLSLAVSFSLLRNVHHDIQ